MNSYQKKLFIEFWNSEISTKELIKLFNFSSEAQLYRTIKKLGLLGKRDPNHPYNQKINFQIKELYRKGYSIKTIANKLKINRDSVHKRLIKLNVERRSCHERNVLYNENKQIKSPYSNKKIIEYIKLYYPKKSINLIAKELKCDNSTIKKRVKALKL